MISYEEIINKEKNKEYFKTIESFLKNERENGKEIYPEEKNIFKAFELTSLENTKVVIIGQDPYHGKGEAMGLSFSVPKGIKVPPSLKNIYKELNMEYGEKERLNGDLTSWAEQGVLLINSVLTVEKDLPASHKKIGWQTFTDTMIKEISNQKENVVFLLFGQYAESKRNLIDENKHFVIVTPHPSPFSARKGFFGSNCFKKTNEYLKNNNIEQVLW